MGCYKMRCKLCGKTVKSENQLILLLKASQHEESKHSLEFQKNKKAHEIYMKEMKKANDKKIANSTTIFGASQWDGEDYVD